jgi:hypothetical protein
MYAALVFLLLIAQAPQAANPAAVDLPAAIQLAQEGRRRRSARRTTEDCGRRSERPCDAAVDCQRSRQMGHPELAEAVYRSVALEDPQNVDALVVWERFCSSRIASPKDSMC